MNDTITVIIPTYNKADFISQTIESVLQQTYKNFEIVIIDDCSSDNTEHVVQKYLSGKIRYFKHKTNWGPGETFNDGIKKARTEYITLIASDDILLPAHLELVINEFKKDKKIETVFSKLQVIDENNNYLNKIQEPPYIDKYKLLNTLFYIENRIPSPGIAFKKSLFNKTKMFNPNLILMHDYDLNIRCMMYGEIAVLPEPTVLYRRFSDNCNLSGDNNWYAYCHTAENNIILDNYLNLTYTDMIKTFPDLESCLEKDIKFKFIAKTCKNEQKRLSEWAFEKLIEYLNTHPDFFCNNDLNFQYKDYIDLYKAHAEKNIIKLTHKQKLFKMMKDTAKMPFGVK